MLPQQQTSAVFFLPQPVAAFSATFITTASRRRQRPCRNSALQQHEVSEYIFAPQVFSEEEIKTNTDMPVYGPGYEETVHEESKTGNLPLHSYLASLCVDYSGVCSTL